MSANRKISISNGASERDLPALAEIPALNCSREMLYKYFADDVEEYDLDEDTLRSFPGCIPSRDDPSFEVYLRHKLRAIREMASGLYTNIPSGYYVAVHKDEGLLASAKDRRKFQQEIRSRKITQYFEFCLRCEHIAHAHVAYSHNLPPAPGEDQSPLQYMNVIVLSGGYNQGVHVPSQFVNARQTTLLIDTSSEDTFFIVGTFTSLISNPYNGTKTFTYTGGPPETKRGRIIYVVIDGMRTCVTAFLGNDNILGMDVLTRYDANVDYSRDVGAYQLTRHLGEVDDV